MKSFDKFLRGELDALVASHLRRTLRNVDDLPPGTRNFAGNDYLGLSQHPALIQAAREATARHGTGAGASRLITGTDSEVLALERELAAWKESEAALVFGSGFAAALGTIPSIVGQGDTVILDKLSHASLIDGARLSGAAVRTFPHNNLDRLEAILTKVCSVRTRTLVVTESIFSMDGDVAPLQILVELKRKHGAWLLVDEAHATGLYAPTGAGLIAEAGLTHQVEIILGTLSKAIGSVGGYVAGSRELIDFLSNRARSFVYSTALPPGAIAASRAALKILQEAEGATLRERLRRHIERFQQGLVAASHRRPASDSAIQPLICGEPSAALAFSADLQRKGFFAPAIRYPTVSRHAARLRVTLNASHGAEDIDALNRALATLHFL